MNATQLRKLGFDEAADAADAQQWEGERARVLVQHVSKSPVDADLCAGIAAALEREGERRGYIAKPHMTQPEAVRVAEAKMDDHYRALSDGKPDGIVEHDDWTEGIW